jgi:hypothetical protein
VREVGPDRHLALAAEMDAQDARQLAQRLLLGEPSLQKIAQRDRWVVAHQHVAAVQQDGQHLPPGAWRAPGFREQRLENRILLVRTASPEDDHRHQLHIEQRVGHRLADQAGQQGRVAAVVARPAGRLRSRLRKKNERGRRCLPSTIGSLGARQAGSPRLFEEHQQVREMPVLQDVTDRLRRVEAQFARACRENRSAYP